MTHIPVPGRQERRHVAILHQDVPLLLLAGLAGGWGAGFPRIASEERRGEAGFPSRTAAKRALQGWQSELLAGRYVAKENEKLSVSDLLDSYERDLKNRSAKSMISFRAYAKALREGPVKGCSKERKGGLGALPAVAVPPDLVEQF